MDFMRTLALLCIFAVLLTGCGRKPPAPADSSQPPESEISTSAPASSSAPDTDPRADMAEKLRAGIARNKDTIGWIIMPGTTIDAAVVQAEDNAYYLRLNEDRRYEVFGCYFMDYDAKTGTRGELSRNNIIYGHSDLRDNKDGPKFSQLFRLLDIDFMESYPYIYYATTQEAMVWQIFAVFFTHINFDYIEPDPTDARFLQVLNEAKLRSEYIIDVPIKAGDKILTLSTCTVNYNPTDPENYRLVVMAKLLPSDAVLSVPQKALGNPSPKRS